MKLISFVILCLSAFASNISAQIIDISKRPIQVERSHDFDAIHYKLNLFFDLDKKEFYGENTVTLKALKNDFRECILDAQELIITEVLNSNNAPLKFDHTDQKLIIYLSRAFSYGDEVTFTIKYSARGKMKGFFFSDETSRNPKMISTDSWPNEARTWFPCYDYPNDKVTMELIATVKQPNKILSNGKLISVTENKEDNTVTYHWHQQKPHSTYLSMVAIAPFAVVKDSLGSLPINYWVYEDDVEDARRIFKKTPEMIEYFNKLFGYDYPWAKYDQVATPTQGGGAEATSATILGQNVITDKKGDKDFSWQRIIAHEVAHQWWGDLITLRTWSETWLNESFATYSDYLYTRHDMGEDEGAIAFLGKKNAYLKEARNKYIRPIVYTRYENPGQNFDSHTYPKGASVLQMLRFVIGDDAFFRTLKHFLHKHEFQPVETRDFMIAVKEVTGQNLDWFFEQYIYKPGHAVFNISYDWIENLDKVQLKVSQVQDFSAGVPVYRTPVKISITTSKETISEKVWIKEKDEVFEFSVTDKPLLVRFDEGNYLLKEWTFDKSSDELLYQLTNDDVIGRMWAASELIKFENSNEVFEKLSNSAISDPFWAVRKEALESLDKFSKELQNDFLKKLCKDENSNVRTSAIRILGNKRTKNLVTFFIEQFNNEDSYVVQAEALRAIGKTGVRSNRNFLDDASKMKSPRDVLKRAAEWALNEINK